MATKKPAAKQNLTVSLDSAVIRKARIVAARRSTSVSGLVAQEIERLAGEEEAYERAKMRALVLLDRGFRLGPPTRLDRDELHER